MPEVWKPVLGYEGEYEVSNLGQVRSVDRHCPGKDGRSELHRGKILKPWANTRCRYLYVTLTGKKKRMVHTLVAESFLGPRPEGHDVMHKNGDRQDNRVENLQYGTRAENLHDTYAYGGRMKKLSLPDVDVIRDLLREGVSPIAIAAQFGVDNAAIYHIRNGTTYKWYPEVV